jgi:hypothetical protein
MSIISTYNGSHAIINCLRFCTYDGFIAGLSLKDNSKVRYNAIDMHTKSHRTTTGGFRKL